MCAPSIPKPPDPYATAAAQTGTNIGTAIANANMQMVNQKTPWGDLTYNQRGTYRYTDPNPATSPDSSGGSGGVTYVNNPTGVSGGAPDGGTRMINKGNLSGENIATISQAGNPQYMDSGGGGGGDGQVTYDIPLWEAEVTLPWAQQQALDKTQRAKNRLSDAALDRATFLKGYLPNKIDPATLPDRGQTPDAPKYYGGKVYGGDIADSYGTGWSKDRRRVENAMFKRMNPQIKRDRSALENRLASQGIALGSEAWKREMDDFDRRVNDARTGVVLAGGQEQSRLAGLARDRATFQNMAQGQRFGQNMQNRGLYNKTQTDAFNAGLAHAQSQNAKRGQALQERLTLRNQPLNEIAALLSGSQVQNPNFSVAQPGAIPTTDMAGLINTNYGQQMGAYNTQMGQRNSLLGGLMGLGSNMIMASDRRLKRDAVKVRDGRLPVWRYRYQWDEPGTHRLGYMADEVAKVVPEAIKRMGNYLSVDYSRLPEVV